LRDTLSIHRLVQAVVLLEIDISERLKWCERLISALCHEIPSEFESFGGHIGRIMEVYAPHIRHITLQFAQWSEQNVSSKELVLLLLTTVIYFNHQGLFDDVESLARIALSSSELVNGPEHPNTITSLRNLSYYYASQGNYKVAESYSQRELIIRKKVSGIEDKDSLKSLHDLAYIYHLSQAGHGEECNIII